MTGAIVLLGVLAGLDNLQACSAVGALPLGASQRRRFAISVALCELVAPLVGLALGRAALSVLSRWSAHAGAALTLVCGAAVILRAVRGQELGSFADSRRLLLLPLALGLDNLTAGAGISALPGPLVAGALVVGATSAAMSCVGLYLGRWLRQILPARLEVLAGGYLCALAVRGWMQGGL